MKPSTSVTVTCCGGFPTRAKNTFRSYACAASVFARTRAACHRRGETPGGEALEGLLGRLTDVLVHKGPPPIEQELAELGLDDDEPVAMTVPADDELPAFDVDAGLLRMAQAALRAVDALDRCDRLG